MSHASANYFQVEVDVANDRSIDDGKGLPMPIMRMPPDTVIKRLRPRQHGSNGWGNGDGLGTIFGGDGMSAPSHRCRLEAQDLDR